MQIVLIYQYRINFHVSCTFWNFMILFIFCKIEYNNQIIRQTSVLIFRSLLRVFFKHPQVKISEKN